MKDHSERHPRSGYTVDLFLSVLTNLRSMKSWPSASGLLRWRNALDVGLSPVLRRNDYVYDVVRWLIRCNMTSESELGLHS